MSAEKSHAFRFASLVFVALASSVATAQDVMDVAAQQQVVEQVVQQQPQLQALPVAQAYAAAPLQYDPITDGQPVTRVFKLAHANADEVAERFNAIWSGEFGTTWRIFRIATSFPEANAVMVTAPTRILDMCEEVIAEIDQEARQVYIEARFVELGNTASHKLGIDWSMLDGMTGSATLGGGFQNTSIGNAVTSYQKTTVSNTKTESYALSSPTTSVIGYGGASGTTPITAVTGGKDGDISFFNGTLNFSEMYLTLRALESTEDARIFSNPKIIVSSGKKATVDMTTKYPNVLVSAKRTLNGNAESLDLAMQMLAIPGEDKFMFAREAFFSWGISLDVIPRIGTNGLINVTIVPTISDLDTSYGTDGFVTAGEGQAEVSSYASKYPIIKVQRLITEFNMASGTTAVIGGLSRTVEAQKDSGIPWLRKIPWIGPKLFGSKVRVKEQREIIVFVTVGLVDPKRMSRDAGLPKNAVLGRQYVRQQKLEPGDRPEKNMEGIESLDMRSLEEQAKDPLRKAGQQDSGFMNIKNYLPFKKGSDGSGSSSEESDPEPRSDAEEEQTVPSSPDASATETL
jgi:type II secretory pathway component GspD/PulD (secretin)